MEKAEVTAVIEKIEKEFGLFPYDFFRLLTDCENKGFDYESENKTWGYIKDEGWHDLNMDNYILWATTDNADLIWWNGERVIAMSPRSSEYMSIKIRPLNFIREISRGTITGIFPHDLWQENS
ncbi:MAG: hypothetical protein OQL19_10975 [Gammaproteobacteria bacterium]|nr:hypothetical protein [Gammaproteobacteria bacterium]